MLLLLPDSYLWWGNPPKDAAAPQPPPDPHAKQGYPRFSLHGLVQQFRLGFATTTLARRAAPAARAIVVITNEADMAVDNAATAALVADWGARGAANLTAYTFPASEHLPHDLVDPAETNSRIDLAYPKLIELINVP